MRAALERLNPTLPPEAIAQASEEITRDRSRMSLAAANQEVYRLVAVNEFLTVCTLLAVIAEKIRLLGGPVDISEVMADVEELLDRSIATYGYAIQAKKPVDLSQND